MVLLSSIRAAKCSLLEALVSRNVVALTAPLFIASRISSIMLSTRVPIPFLVVPIPRNSVSRRRPRVTAIVPTPVSPLPVLALVVLVSVCPVLPPRRPRRPRVAPIVPPVPLVVEALRGLLLLFRINVRKAYRDLPYPRPVLSISSLPPFITPLQLLRVWVSARSWLVLRWDVLPPPVRRWSPLVVSLLPKLSIALYRPLYRLVQELCRVASVETRSLSDVTFAPKPRPRVLLPLRVNVPLNRVPRVPR